MKKKILIFIAILIFLLANNFIWFGNYIDSSLKIDSISSELYWKKEALEDLKKLSLEINKDTSRDELIKIIKENIEHAEIFEMDGNVYYQKLGFEFKKSRLVRITTEVPLNPASKG